MLVLRESTERPEAVDAGGVELVGANATRIVERSLALLEDDDAHARMATRRSPYGDGHAAERVVEKLVERFAAPRAQAA